MLGKFVTAKLKGQIDPRQGWVVSESPLLIQGQSGTIYECEGIPIEVINPPNKKMQPTPKVEPLKNNLIAADLRRYMTKGNRMINRKALLYKDWKKEDAPFGTVTVLYIGTVADEDGSCIAASVEQADGEVVEVAHDRLKFI